MAERAVAVGDRGRQRLHQPGRSRRDQPLQSRQGRGHGGGAIDGPPHVVHQRRGQQFLVIGPLGPHAGEHLQRVLEHVALGMLDGILPHGGQDRHHRRDLVEAIAREPCGRHRRIEAAGHLVAHLGMARQLIGGHPAPGHPSCRPKHRPRGIAAAGDAAGRGLGDPPPQGVVVAVAHRGPGPPTGRQRRFRSSAVVA
jgi:hypothetical protein